MRPSGTATVPDDAPAVVRRVLSTAAAPYVRVSPAAEDVEMDPTHYRILHHDLRDMSAEQATTHWERHGRDEGRRAMLSPEEVSALAQWSAEHYRLLNPDVAEQDDETLLRHFLHHGRSEGRAGWVDAEGMERLARLRVTDYLALNPDLDGSPPSRRWRTTSPAGGRRGGAARCLPPQTPTCRSG